jgi:hypothetical protein
MMPFSAEWSTNVWEVIHEAFVYEAVTCTRADTLRGSVILNDIVDGIARSTLLLADVTGANPNVIYEIGVAHAWELDVLMITQEPTRIPFDTSSLRHIVYNTSPSGLEELSVRLRQIARHATGSVVPAKIEIVRSSDALSTLQFLGQWEGNWVGPQPGKLAHTLVIYEITGSKASVVYFYGDCPEWHIHEAGHRYIFGNIVGNVLLLEWPDISIKYHFRDGNLRAERVDRGRMFYCDMERVR